MPNSAQPTPEPDPACDVAHGTADAEPTTRSLVAVFSSPVAEFLLRYARDIGYRPVLFDPDPDRAARFADQGIVARTGLADVADADTDVVVTDHHRAELGTVLRDALAAETRWIGVMGNPRHPGPHVAALTVLGVEESEIARVHRPIGLNIGSRTPPEIAIATIAGLLADRNNRPGTFEF